MHWPAPIRSSDIERDRGPVLVTVAYQIEPEDQAALHRGGDGSALRACATAPTTGASTRTCRKPGRLVETFSLDSWIDHLRQHERVTNADREQQEIVNRYQVGGVPEVTHLVAP